MAPRVDPVASDEALPARTEVVIIGGGIIGTCTALFLAQRGIPVVLCEKGHIAGEQSSRNWGWCRKMGRDPRELPLIVESMRLWQGMNGLTGAETGFRQSGIMYLAEMASFEAWMEHARQYQLDTALLSADAVAAAMPASAKRWRGALHTPSDGRAEPQQAAPAIALAARAQGASILTQCAVRGIETKAGRVEGVVTERGRIGCAQVVLAGGAWSGLFAGNLGIRLPQLKVLASVMRTQKLDGAPDCSATGTGFGFRKRLDGGYNISNRAGNRYDIVPDSFRYLKDFLPVARIQASSIKLRLGQRFIEEWQLPRRWSLDTVSPFEKMRVLDPAPAEDVLADARTAIAAAFPVFRDMQVAESWAGLMDVTPDAVPVISPVADLPGLVIATGFSGHGFGIGPGAGRLAADLVTGSAPTVDPTPFRLSRFSEPGGSRPFPVAI